MSEKNPGVVGRAEYKIAGACREFGADLRGKLVWILARARVVLRNLLCAKAQRK